MAYEFYVKIEGTHQGVFKGEVPQGKHKDKIAGIAFEYSVSSPRDIHTGAATGTREHKPVRITKEWGAATPQIFAACVTNEVLKKVTIEFIKKASDGKEHVFHSIKLTNATVMKVEQFSAPKSADAGGSSTAVHTSSADLREMETVSLTFSKIELENLDGQTSAEDDWNAGG